MSAAFSLADCPTCQGEGFVFIHEGHTDEALVRCAECDGTGTCEVCAACGEAPTVEAGLEVCPCTRSVALTRQGKEVTVTCGAKDLGYCAPAVDEKGVSHGWNAYANQRPANGFARAVLEEFVKLRDAVVFVTREGVAL